MINISPLKFESTNQKMILTYPFLVNYNDEISIRLKNFFENTNERQRNQLFEKKNFFNPIQVESEMLSKSLWTVFTGLPKVDTKLAKERAARLQELLHFCSNSDLANAGN